MNGKFISAPLRVVLYHGKYYPRDKDHAGSEGAQGMRAPLSIHFYFIFMEFSAKILPKTRLVLQPLGLSPAPTPGKYSVQ